MDSIKVKVTVSTMDGEVLDQFVASPGVKVSGVMRAVDPTNVLAVVVREAVEVYCEVEDI